MTSRRIIRAGHTGHAGLAAIAGLALACVACADHAARQRDATKELTSMDDLVRHLDRHPAVTITIQQGTEHFDDGVITLAVRGDGTATVDQLRSGKSQRYSSRLAADRLASFGAELADHQLTRARTTTLPRQPGDTPLVLRVDGEGTPFRADLWYGDRYQDRDLDQIIRVADAVVHEVSGGALGQPAAAK
jgi:hypothetical protein